MPDNEEWEKRKDNLTEVGGKEKKVKEKVKRKRKLRESNNAFFQNICFEKFNFVNIQGSSREIVVWFKRVQSQLWGFLLIC